MNPDLSWTCIGKAISAYHIQTREWLNRVKIWFWMKIFNSICYRIMVIYCTTGPLLDCCFSEKTESFELTSPPSAAPLRTYPRMHFNGLNIVSQHFYTMGNNGFPSAAEHFPPSPCVCQYKSSSSTQHSKYLSMCHFISLIRRYPRMLVPPERLVFLLLTQNWLETKVNTACEQKTHSLIFSHIFFLSLSNTLRDLGNGSKYRTVLVPKVITSSWA